MSSEGLRTAIVQITSPPAARNSRDIGKTYLIQEWVAEKAEWWALRLILALGRAGVEVDDTQPGMAGVAGLDFKSIMRIDPLDAKPLLDEMMECVFILPDPKAATRRPATAPGDIEEVFTRLFLRKEIFRLHTGFSTPDADSQDSTSGTASQEPSGTPTSLTRSAP